MPSCNNDKNETTRFLGDGVSFKAKLIGILEVSEARGDRMCQEALSDLKMAIRAAGEHKQRITIHIALDGLRLRDEKTGDSLYHHPVHKISFIAQDMTDSRAFGYIFGSPDTGHRFFGIKTDKAASQVVIAMRDLFQVVFALKKKEIELAKIHLEKTRYATSPIFSESSTLNAKSMQQDKSVLDHNKAGASSAEAKSSGTAVADLVDLELELNSLQQGLNQMERITPSDPFGSKDDPFGDSFISYPKPILPPPPSSGRDRSNRVSESSSIFSPKTPHITATSVDTNSDSLLDGKKDFSFSHDFNSSHEEPSSGDWFTPSAGNSLFEEPPSLVPTEPTKDEKHELAKQEILSQFHVFTELDPLELKNPPKKVLNDLVGNQIAQTQDQANMFSTKFATSPKPSSFSTSGNNVSVFSSDPFGEDPFVTEDPFAEADFTRQDPFETEFNHSNATLNTFRKSRISPRTVLPSATTFNKPPQFEYQFEENRKYKMNQLHENPSLDMSSESECAPEPPPRPASTLMQQIKPPPLPPKKQNDIAIKPPPRPRHTEDSHYDYIDNYETAPNSLEFNRLNASELSPPLPVPARKSKFESDFSAAPQRPLKKHYNLQSSEDDYLTPIGGGILLPPPQKSSKKQALERKSSELDGLDITLSQLTLSGLNELANKLKIPASQLSNMTLVQLTNYLSNFIKGTSTPNNTQESSLSNNMNSEAGGFQADFAANFNKLNANEAFDRYAVFRELMQEEIKQTKIDTEPEELLEETQQSEVNSNVSLDLKPLDVAAQDKYAALREIVEKELKQNEHLEKSNSNDTENDDEEDEVEIEEEEIAKTLNKENELNAGNQNTQIEYNNTPVDVNIKDGKLPSPVRSPIKTILKSPVPSAVSEIIQNNTRLTSGSLSDVVSGSSPEVDNTASSDAIKKVPSDAAAESWAIFEQTNNISAKQEKQTVQSEEGVSPWSSDSKEFGNGSPPEYRRKDSGSGGDQWTKRRRDQEGWWDTSAEPEVQYYPPNRRSTDSYEEEYYECYDRPRRRRQGGNWSGKTAGGHSSSSRDVSPWEEEPRRIREPREVTRPGWSRHSGRQQSFDRHKERRNTDSWDEEEDDYEYDDEQGGRFHWTDRHVERDRHSTGSREHESDRWSEDRTDERRHKRRSAGSRDRWCCPDWEQTEHEKCLRYGSGRWIPPDRRDRKDPRYYSRESQESPWEDEYSNGPEDSPYYVAKRNWKQRPSSASEMDRKTGEIKSRHYLGTGGSDGERDRRYKAGRRSRSRDSQYSEPSHRIKSQEIAPGARNTHRTNKSHLHAKPIDAEFPEGPPKKVETVKLEGSTKKPSNLSSRKKAAKEVALKSDESPNTTNTFPRKSRNKFENDFVSPVAEVPSKFKFENDFETEQALAKPLKVKHQLSMLEKSHNLPAEHDYKLRGSFKESKMSPRYHTAKSKSMFEDNFSPCDKPIEPVEENSISSIKEEIDPEEEDSFSISNFEMTTNSRKTILSKNRYARTDLNLKKSDSVNIFARENDPFDDDFFCGNVLGNGDKVSPRSTELRWTEDFEDFDIQGKK